MSASLLASEPVVLGRERRMYASARAKAVAAELEAEFEALKASADAHGRGPVFERLIARLLHMSKFDVVRSAESAPSRQVDITATSPSMSLLVEAKWQRAVVDVSDIAGLADRLDQASIGWIGLFVSMSGFTAGARKRILDDKRALARGRTSILLDAADVADLMTGRFELRPLLEHRLELLRVHSLTEEPEVLDRERFRVTLPPADVLPVEQQRLALPSAAYDVVYVDASWRSPDPSVSYQLTVPLPESRGTIEDVRELLELAHASLVLSSGGGFTITQMGPTPMVWHGAGVEPLLTCLASQRQRYSKAKIKNPHHSEDFALVVPFEDGWLALTGRQSAREADSVRQLRLELRLPYLPLDMSGIAAFARRLGLRGIGLATQSRPLVETFWLKPWPSAGPLFYGTETLLGPDFITRAVVDNPWYGNARAIVSPEGDEYPWAGQLAQSSFIEGTVGDALARNERVLQFSLQSVEAIVFSNVTALHVSLHHDSSQRVKVPLASPSPKRKQR